MSRDDKSPGGKQMKRIKHLVISITTLMCLFFVVFGMKATAYAKTSKLPMKVTIDKITYKVGTDGRAEVIRIGSTKKARINFIQVDGEAYPVVKIANNACKSNKVIKEVSFGKCIKLIGKNAFWKCKNLKKVNIYANKDLKVQKNAFKNLPRKARIKVKGVKGKTRDKIKKAIKRQTNANVM
jgi:hypothetical protein